MATRKLQIEVEVETAKAEAKLQSLGNQPIKTKHSEDKTNEKNDGKASDAVKLSLSLDGIIKRTREWKATIDALNNTETSLTERQKELQAEIAKREERERELKRGLAGEAGIGGDDKNFNKLSAERARNASEIDALKALAKQLEKEGKKERGGSAADYSAFDSLARIGGNFAGSEQGFRDLQRTNEAQLETLKSIERKTGKGGTF